MTLFREPDDLETHCRQLGELLVIGGAQLEALAKAKKQITFQTWSEIVRKATSPQAIKNEQLEWLWEALTTEPTIRRMLGTRLVSREEEWRKLPPATVLGSGETLGIFLKGLWPLTRIDPRSLMRIDPLKHV